MTRKIEAIIREDTLETVKDKLTEIGIMGLNIRQVRGRGRQGGMKRNWRTGSYVVDLLPRIQLNIAFSDDTVEATGQAIQEAAYSGLDGDGLFLSMRSRMWCASAPASAVGRPLPTRTTSIPAVKLPR